MVAHTYNLGDRGKRKAVSSRSTWTMETMLYTAADSLISQSKPGVEWSKLYYPYPNYTKQKQTPKTLYMGW